MSATTYDAAILGAGHNGLVCAYYLARRGLKTIVLERRHVVGGAAVTEEFHPGFRNSVAAYTVSLLSPDVIREMELARHGLRVAPRKVANFLPTEDGRALALGGGDDAAAIAAFSQTDAEAYPRYQAMLARILPAFRKLLNATPPNPKGGVRDAFAALATARALNDLSIEAQRDLLDLFAKSAGDLLDGWFESAPLKAILGFDSVVGSFQSPYAPGSAYVLLHHVFGEVNGVAGAWGHAIGGMGAITQAMAAAAAEAGAEIRLAAPVSEILTEKGRVASVALENGDTVRAHRVISSLSPTLTFGRLIDPALLSDDFRQRIADWRAGSATFRMNAALSELPRFTARPAPGDHLTAGVILAPSLRHMDRAWRDAVDTGMSMRPIVEMLIPSTLDDTLAPEGRHVASLFCQHFAYDLPDGRSWDEARDEAADRIIACVNGFAPGFAQSVIARSALSPLDLERDFALPRGDIFHGQLTLNQLFSARPVLGHGDYRGPVPGLYMCGSGSHPGGGVTGLPGRNAAREILRDARKRL